MCSMSFILRLRYRYAQDERWLWLGPNPFVLSVGEQAPKSNDERPSSHREQIGELVHRHRLEPLRVVAHVEDRVLLLHRKAPCEIGAELGFEQRYAVLAPAAMADRIFDADFRRAGAVLEEHLHRIRDR